MASTRENLSSGFPKKRDSNQSPQLQRLDRIVKFRSNDTFQKANNKGAHQTARMRRLVCACVVRKPSMTGFLASRPNIIEYSMNEKEIKLQHPS